MSTVSRTAGAAGSVTVTIKNTSGSAVTPVSTPTVVWYTDTGRTAGATTLSVSGSGSSYTASWTAGQAPATPASRYLKVTIEVSTGVFDTDVDDDISFVDAASSITSGLCTVAEVKSQLGKTSSADDAEIQAYIDAVTAPIEDYIGAVLPATVTNERHEVAGLASFHLLKGRASAITSVTEYVGQTSYTYTAVTTPAAAGPYTYLRDGENQLCKIDASGRRVPFAGDVYVSYTAGFADIPANVNLAARLLVQHLWRTQQGGAGLPQLADEVDAGAVIYETLKSPRIRMLLEPYRSVGGFA